MKLKTSALLLGAFAFGLMTAPLCPVVAQTGSASGPAHKMAPFFLKDGDRVVFYGDSITDQRMYTTYVETYCLTRFPTKNFTFIHSGWGGDRVTGGGGGPVDLRLKRDVIVYKPTVVTICLGMNDASYSPFKQEIFDTYVNGYRHIIETLQKEIPGVRLTLLTASAFDDVTQTAKFPGGYNSTLTTYGEAVKQLGEDYNIPVADTNAPLVAVLNRAETADPTLATKIIPDRVHPGAGGHLVMAAALLKAWNAPSTVAAIEIDASSNKIVRQKNTRLSEFKTTDTSLSFTHMDNALPWPFDHSTDAGLTLAVSDIEKNLNLYTLKITGLKGKQYQVSVDGKMVGMVAASDLEKGVDLAAMPELPPNMQASQVLGMTRKHNDLHFNRWRVVQLAEKRNGVDDVPTDVKQKMDALDVQETDAITSLRQMVQPKSHHVEFTLVP